MQTTVNPKIASVSKKIQSNQGYKEYYEALPERPYYSETKRFQPSLFSSKELAVCCPYIQQNMPEFVRSISFDLDYDDAREAWAKQNVVTPTLIKVNPKNGHCEYDYRFAYPIPLQNSSAATKKLFSAVKETYKEVLSADFVKIRAKTLHKNALHDKWEVLFTGKEISLSDMSASLAGRTLPKRRHTLSTLKDFGHYVGIGRNTTMFDYTRHFAYAITHEHDSINTFKYILQLEIEARQKDLLLYFPAPLPTNEVHSIARSVATFCLKNKDEITSFRKKNNKNYGAMGFKPIRDTLVLTHGYLEKDKFCSLFEEERANRQALGASFTNKKRTSNTEVAILQALYLAEGTGQPITARLLCNMTDIHLATIYRHRHLWGG